MITFISCSAHDRLLFSAIRQALARRGVEANHLIPHEFADEEQLFANIHKHGLLVLWNGMAPLQLEAVKRCRAHMMRVAYCEHGVIPLTTAIDPLGVNARSTVARLSAGFLQKLRMDAERMEALYARPLNQRPLPEGVATDATDDGAALPDTYALLALQVHDDSQIRNLSPGFTTMGQVIDETARACAELGLPLVVKAHPSDEGRVSHMERVRLYPGVRYLVTSTIEDLLKGAACLITANSAGGVEALLRRVPVVTLGEATYPSIHPEVSRALPEAIRVTYEQGRSLELFTELAPRWLYYMAYHYLMPVWAFAPDDAGCGAAAQRLQDIHAGRLPWLTDVDEE